MKTPWPRECSWGRWALPAPAKLLRNHSDSNTTTYINAWTATKADVKYSWFFLRFQALSWTLLCQAEQSTKAISGCLPSLCRGAPRRSARRHWRRRREAARLRGSRLPAPGAVPWQRCWRRSRSSPETCSGNSLWKPTCRRRLPKPSRMYLQQKKNFMHQGRREVYRGLVLDKDYKY